MADPGGRNGNGNGNGDPSIVSRIADSVWTTLASRAMQIFGIPLICFVGYQGFLWLGKLADTASSTAWKVEQIQTQQAASSTATEEIRNSQAAAAQSIKAIEMEQRYQSARTGAIEKKLDIEPPPRFWEDK